MQKTILMMLFIMAITLTGCKDKEQAAAPAPAAAPEAPAEEVLPDNPVLKLSEWLGLGETVKCTVLPDTGAVDVWASAGQVKIAGIGFDPKNPEAVGNMLSDGTWVYTWTGNTGFKFNAQEAANAPQGGAASNNGDWTQSVSEWESKNVDYVCEKREADPGIFAVPNDVTFSDLGALLEVASSTSDTLMNQLPGNTEDVEAALEAAGVTPRPNAGQVRGEIEESLPVDETGVTE
jgi:hypothetical protein